MTKKSTFTEQLLKGAQTINDMQETIHRTFKNRQYDPQAWQEATQALHESYDALAFPGGLNNAISSLLANDSHMIDLVITYLQADPYYFRSGYIKEDMALFLKRVQLTDEQKKEIQNFLVMALKKGYKERGFREYCRLARIIADDDFCTKLGDIMKESDDPYITQATQSMLDAIKIYKQD